MKRRRTADELMRPKYAWTDWGPVVIHGANYYRTSYVRKWLKEHHNTNVERWARNWIAFEGYAPTIVHMPNPY